MKYSELVRGLKIIDSMVSQRGYDIDNIDINIINFQDGCNGVIKQRVEGTMKFQDDSTLTLSFSPTYH